MKKWSITLVAFLLVMALTFLTACGGNSSSSQGEQPDNQENQQQEEKKEKVAERIISNARDDESIIVFHDRIEIVPQVLDIIIPELRNKGFEFVTISQLDKKGVIK